MRRFKGRRRFGVKKTRYDKKQDKRISRLSKAIDATIQYKTLSSTGNLAKTWSTVGALWLLNGMAVGTNEGERVGNKIRCVGLDLNIQLNTYAVAAAGDGFTIARVMVIRDVTAKGLNPVRAELFADGSSDITAFYSPQNKLFSKDYHILYDSYVHLNMGSWNSTGGTIMKVCDTRKFKKRLNFRTLFNANAATIANFDTNSLFLAVIVPTSDTVAYNFVATLAYTA